MQQPRPSPIQRSQLFSIWWLRTWRGALGGVIAMAPFAAGFYFLERAGIQSTWLRLVEQVLVVVIGAGVAFAVSRMSLAKRYLGFRIALLPDRADGPELSITNRRVLSFWWLLVWRATLGAGVIGFLGSLATPLLPAKHAVQAVVVVAILAWEFAMLRMALTKRYRDFRIVLITEPPQR